MSTTRVDFSLFMWICKASLVVIDLAKHEVASSLQTPLCQLFAESLSNVIYICALLPWLTVTKTRGREVFAMGTRKVGGPQCYPLVAPGAE